MNRPHFQKMSVVGALTRTFATPFVSLLIAAPALSAQQAVTVSGHVTAAGAPLVGAHVRIADLKPPIERVTDDAGHYSLIVPSASVHGQTVRMSVTMSDRRIRYAPATADLQLLGVPVVQDFDLKILSGNQPAVPVADTLTSLQGRPHGPITAAAAVDTLTLVDVPGAVDVFSAMAGRYPNLGITQPGVLGGSSSAIFRGPRSILGSSQPLVVVDGLPVENEVFTSTAQRYGLGGFDYGSPLQDLDLSTLATARFLTGPEASARFGGRAANGVLLLTTKDGVGGPAFAITAHQQITSETPGRLPEFQNQYGQGLNGKFSFFDGKGGGVNDAVDQSWGPPLDNRPIAQASLTEPGRGDVRLWQPHPDNVTDYFSTGRTLNTTAAIQGASSVGSFRAGVSDRDTRGLTPNGSLNRRLGTFHINALPTDGMTASAWIAGGETKDLDAAGTGFNQGNPVAEFTRMGRQVDATTLRAHLVDSAGQQISWNYAGQNNPYFQSIENSNSSDRDHVAGGGSLSMTLQPWLTATAQAGTDYYRDTRLFTIRSGWMGGFPFYAAPSGGSFSKGGFEGDQVLAQQTNAALKFDASRVLTTGVRWTVAAGGDMSSTRNRLRSAEWIPRRTCPSRERPTPPAFHWRRHGTRTRAPTPCLAKRVYRSRIAPMRASAFETSGPPWRQASTRRRCIRRCPAAWTSCERWLRSERSRRSVPRSFAQAGRTRLGSSRRSRCRRCTSAAPRRARLRPPVRARSSPIRISRPRRPAPSNSAPISPCGVGGSTWASPRIASERPT